MFKILYIYIAFLQTKQWYLLPDVDVWQSEKIAFVCPFVEAMDSVRVVYILESGHVIAFYEQVDWVMKTSSEDGSEEGGGAQGAGEGEQHSQEMGKKTGKNVNASGSKYFQLACWFEVQKRLICTPLMTGVEMSGSLHGCKMLHEKVLNLG